MNFVDLVEFVFAWKEGEETEYFEHDAPHAPNVHFVAVVAVSQEALGSSVPPRRNVLSQRWLVVDASATPQVRQFNELSVQQDVLSELTHLRFYVSVEDSVAVHVL